MKLKRFFDLFFAIPGLLILSPLFLFVAAWIKFDSPGSVLFQQTRVGIGGKLFKIYKFRTMVSNAEQIGKKITVGGDPRITRCGHFLRKYKLDELPQLFNVIKGEMSLVGPRPEVSEYVAYYTEREKKIILSVPPGMTDFASLEFHNENEILKKALDPQKEYIENIMPIKLNYYVKYVQERSLVVDFILIIKTIRTIIT